MALDLRQNLVSAQYLDNYLTYFHQTLYMHSSWLDLAWDCFTLPELFRKFVPELWPLIYAEISFLLNILTTT